jgi:GR25 family glycosyltransferase involved in LPS biosynthesis
MDCGTIDSTKLEPIDIKSTDSKSIDSVKSNETTSLIGKTFTKELNSENIRAALKNQISPDKIMALVHYLTQDLGAEKDANKIVSNKMSDILKLLNVSFRSNDPQEFPQEIREPKVQAHTFASKNDIFRSDDHQAHAFAGKNDIFRSDDHQAHTFASKNDNLNLHLSKNSLKAISPVNAYFDKVYLLNLDRRQDRLQNMVNRLARWNITDYVRFPAIDGVTEPHYSEWRHYMKSRLSRMERIKYHRKAIASAGSWAILKSMYLLLVHAQAHKYEKILILQDDVLFHKAFNTEFVKMCNTMPDDWKLLYLGASQHNWNNVIHSKTYYYPNGSSDGAFAVGINCNVYAELLGEILKFEMPVDSGALRTVQANHLYQSYVLFPNLIIADIRDSDLRQSRDFNHCGKKFKWDSNLYDIPTA